MKITCEDRKNWKSLKKRADFLHIQRNGRKCVSHGLILQALENDLGHCRIGFTITKKTEKSAVKRNRIKRRLRAVASDIASRYAKTSCDYVLIGRPATLTRSYMTLCGDLRWCLGKLGYEKSQEDTIS